MSLAVRTQTLTIANGATTSDAFVGDGYAACGLVLPATFTGTALTFSVSADGSAFATLYDSSNAAISLTVTQARAYSLPDTLASWKAFKVISGSTEGGARLITVVGKG